MSEAVVADMERDVEDSRVLVTEFATKMSDVTQLQFIREDPGGVEIIPVKGSYTNFAYRVMSRCGQHSVFIKHGVDHVKVDPTQPMPLVRRQVEYDALVFIHRLSPGACPVPYGLDMDRNVVAMEDCGHMEMYYTATRAGRVDEDGIRQLGLLLARLHTDTMIDGVDGQRRAELQEKFSHPALHATILDFYLVKGLEPGDGTVETHGELGDVMDEVHNDRSLMERACGYRTLAAQPQCLVHHDCHQLSIFMSHDRVAIYDLEFTLLGQRCFNLAVTMTLYVVLSHVCDVDDVRERYRRAVRVFCRGLGRDEAGMKEAIKVKLKFDTAGVGHNVADEHTYRWWDHVFNSAANNIKVDESGGEVKVTCGENVKISTKKPASKNQDKSLLYGRFIKSGTLDNGVLEKEEQDGSSSDSDDESGPSLSLDQHTDEQLFKLCGGLTAHKGARHGLNARAKLARVEEQEAAFMAKWAGINSGESTQNGDGNKQNGDKKTQNGDKKQAENTQNTDNTIHTTNKRKRKAEESTSINEEQEESQTKKKKKSKKSKNKDEEKNEGRAENEEEMGIDTEIPEEGKRKKKKKKSKTEETEEEVCEETKKEEKDRKKKEKRKIKNEQIVNEEEITETEVCESSSKKKNKKKKKEMDENTPNVEENTPNIEDSTMDIIYEENVEQKSKKKKKKSKK